MVGILFLSHFCVCMKERESEYEIMQEHHFRVDVNVQVIHIIPLFNQSILFLD